MDRETLRELALFKRFFIAVLLIAIFAIAVLFENETGIQATTGLVGAIVGFYFVRKEAAK